MSYGHHKYIHKKIDNKIKGEQLKLLFSQIVKIGSGKKVGEI